MAGKGWSSSEDDLWRVRFLDWVYDNAAGGSLPNVSGFVEAEQPFVVDRDTMKAIVNGLEREGLIHVNRTLAGPLASSVGLTSDGRSDVRRRRERRKPSIAREVACRDGLLAWLDAQRWADRERPAINEFFFDVRSFFEGEQYQEAEVHRASLYLHDKGLINGSRAWGGGVLRPGLTTDGIDVIEHYDGSTLDYFRPQPVAQAGAAAPQYNQYIYGGQGGQAGRDLHQSQQVGLNVTEILALMQTIREAASEAPEEDASRVIAIVRQIEEEARSDEPDQPWLRSLVERLQLLGGKVGNTALATAVSVATSGAIQAL